MENDLVSIIIPVYNTDKYLGECLESVINQTYKNLQVICVDDASTDNSLSILKKYSAIDTRIQIIINENNEGPAFSRNVGFTKTEGKYTYFLDSDDYIKPDAIERLYFYAENNNVEAIYFNSSICGDFGIYGRGPSVNYAMEDNDKKIYDGPTLFKIMNDKGVYVNSVWRRFWRTDFLVNHNLRFENALRTSEDFPFSVQAILLGKRMMVINETFHVYRRHDGTITTGASKEKVINIFKGYCILLDFWREHQFETDVDDVLRKYLNDRLISVKRFYFRNKNKVSKDSFELGFEQHLFEMMIAQEYEKTLNDIDENIVRKIKEYPYIIVYGAHIYAAEVVERLERKGFHIYSLAITHMHEKAEGMNGIPVQEIANLCNIKEDAIVVLGVDKRNREDVITTLKKYGFMNYISLD